MSSGMLRHDISRRFIITIIIIIIIYLTQDSIVLLSLAGSVDRDEANCTYLRR